MYLYNETVSNMCQLHEIQVSSLNDGGNMTSQPSIITATLPISKSVCILNNVWYVINNCIQVLM